MKTVEFCTNDEWYRVFGPLGEWFSINDDTENETAVYIRSAVFALMSDPRAGGLNIVRAKSGRILCHGWNGAQFTFSAGGFGTFADLTEDEKQAVIDADDSARMTVSETHGL